ncbi:MAG: SCO family protein [Balneola sp.]|nr:SCO family protein [Balneola sp.]
MKHYLQTLSKSLIVGIFLLLGNSNHDNLFGQSSHNPTNSSNSGAYLDRPNQESAFIQDIGINEQLGVRIPIELTFAKANGDSVRLADLLSSRRPIILNLLYYECPMLCGLIIDGLFDAVQNLAWQPGKEFDIISLSIDPTEKDSLAARVKKEYIGNESWGATKGSEQYAATIAQVNKGWSFLTGNQPTIDSLTSAVGFGIAPIPGTKDFAHSSAIILLSPDGIVTRYLYGLRFESFDLRTAILEASEGTIGNTIDKLIMYCYQYDANSNSYAPVAKKIMSLGGLATLIFLGIFIGYLWFRESRKTHSITN